eukprot:GHVL01015791.1.p1 GENE.GHVL01015791.1~~GHVL01015791.1.p1  ORF type:complete len:416 (+),score=133.06 GHVL01015791.1:187-1248(+)
MNEKNNNETMNIDMGRKIFIDPGRQYTDRSLVDNVTDTDRSLVKRKPTIKDIDRRQDSDRSLIEYSHRKLSTKNSHRKNSEENSHRKLSTKNSHRKNSEENLRKCHDKSNIESNSSEYIDKLTPFVSINGGHETIYKPNDSYSSCQYSSGSSIISSRKHSNISRKTSQIYKKNRDMSICSSVSMDIVEAYPMSASLLIESPRNIEEPKKSKNNINKKNIYDRRRKKSYCKSVSDDSLIGADDPRGVNESKGGGIEKYEKRQKNIYENNPKYTNTKYQKNISNITKYHGELSYDDTEILPRNVQGSCQQVVIDPVDVSEFRGFRTKWVKPFVDDVSDAVAEAMRKPPKYRKSKI